MTKQRKNTIIIAASLICAHALKETILKDGVDENYLKEHHIYRGIAQAKRISEFVDKLYPTVGPAGENENEETRTAPA
jgi:hypothetical protein